MAVFISDPTEGGEQEQDVLPGEQDSGGERSLISAGVGSDLYPVVDPEQARICRIGLMHRLEPQDVGGMLITTLLGPVRAWEIVSGKRALRREEAEAMIREAPEYRSLLQGRSWKAAVERWAVRDEGPDPQELVRRLGRTGAWFAVPEDEDWPEGLTGLGIEQPLGLWGRGSREGLRRPVRENVAFVGCRDATSYGQSVTAHLAGDLAAQGYGILSGAAFGIDAAAHRAALATAARSPATVAFLACGIDRVYPAAHRELLGQITEQGMLLSEIPPGGSPMRHRFLQRNRLIAALAGVTVVVEARWRSGALNTAHHVSRYGRTLAAVPGSVFSGQSVGCHRLLREEDARLVTTPEDLRLLLEEQNDGGFDAEAEPADGKRAAAAQALVIGEDRLSPEQLRSRQRQQVVDGLDQGQRTVYDALPVRQAAPVDQLVRVAGLAPRQLLPLLGQLEALGLAERQGAGWRVSRRDEEHRSHR